MGEHVVQEAKIPILRGEVSRPKFSEFTCVLKVHCPYCDEKHTHGWPIGVSENTVEHRGAHCSSNTPFKSTGYYIGPNK